MSIQINLLELSLRIVNLSNPLFYLRFGCQKLVVVYSLIITCVNFFEGDKVFESLTKSNQEGSELTLLYIVITKLRFAF